MRRERVWLLLILAIFAAAVSIAIARGAPFEVDESIYATQARAWAAGGPTTGVLPHRAPLMPAIGTVLYKLGARAEWAFRLTGLAFGLAALVLVWALARDIAGPRTGLLAAGVTASSPPFVLRSSQYLTDIPAMAFLLALVLVLWRNREAPAWTLLFAAPLAAGALYARYASILPIGLIVLAAIVLWHRLMSPRWVIPTALLFSALLVPHIVHAVNVTGRPWGLITFTARYASHTSIGTGLRDYAYWFPFALAGLLAGITMTTGIVAAAVKREKPMIFLVAVGLADIIIIGATEHAETRFVFFPVALLCIAGAIVIARMQPIWIPAVAVVAAIAAAGAFVVARTNSQRSARAAPRLVGRIIASQHHPCTVLAVDVGPTTWYTGCSTYYYGDSPSADFMVIYYRGNRTLLRAQPAVLPFHAGAPTQVRDDKGALEATVFPVVRR